MKLTKSQKMVESDEKTILCCNFRSIKYHNLGQKRSTESPRTDYSVALGRHSLLNRPIRDGSGLIIMCVCVCACSRACVHACMYVVQAGVHVFEYVNVHV